MAEFQLHPDLFRVNKRFPNEDEFCGANYKIIKKWKS